MAYTQPGKTLKRVFEFVKQRIQSGFPPTIREVQEAFGFQAVQTAREHMEALVSRGLLTKEPRKARGYRLSGANSTSQWLIPILGRVRAGALTEAIEDIEGYISILSSSYPNQLFGLRVRGESMRDAGIMPDDIVVVRQQASADSGDIVVALIDDEATVKTLKIKEERLELHPENPAFQPIIPDPDELKILGKVIEVRRFLEKPGIVESMEI